MKWIGLAPLVVLSALPAADPEPSRIPECGVASTYAVLKLLGRPVPLAGLEARFREQNPGSDLSTLSLSEIQNALNSYSVYTLGLQVDVRDAKRLPWPSVLYLRPDRLPNNRSGIGHYLVLCSISGSVAELMDLSKEGGFSRRLVPVEELMKYWDGELLAVSLVPFNSSGVSRWLVIADLTLLSLAFGYAAWSERGLVRQLFKRAGGRKASAGSAVALLLCLAGALSGCAGGQPEAGGDADYLPLKFDAPEKNVVLPRGLVPEVEETFTLRAWDKGPVEIMDVASSCGCLAVSPNLIGKKLEANEKQTFFVRMRMNPGEAARTVIVRFVTNPAGHKPVVLTIHGTSASLPSIAPTAINLEAPLGSKSSVNLRVTYFRQKNDPQLTLDPSRSALFPFRVEKSETRSELQVIAPKQIDAFMLDTLNLTLALEHPPALGTHELKMRLAWEGDVPVSEAPVRIEIQHPLAPAFSELFCGEMNGGQTLTRSVPLIRRGATKPRVRSVKAVDPTVSAKVGDSGEALEVSVTAPQKPGRFEAEIVLAYDPPSVPESRLRVAGLVLGKK